MSPLVHRGWFRVCRVAGLACLLVFGWTARAQALAAAEPTMSLTLPGLKWAILIPGAGFDIEEQSIAPDGKAARLNARHAGADIVISAMIEKAAGPVTLKAARDRFWRQTQQTGMKAEGVRVSDAGDRWLDEYLVRSHPARPADQKHLNIYLVKDGFWADVHLSKGHYRTNDDAALRALADHVVIAEPYTPRARDHFVFGNSIYRAEDFKDAVVHLEQARELERVRTTLKPAESTELLLHLGVAYGVCGQFGKAREVLIEGLTRDPDHPMLHYNLACIYGEEKDLDRALDELRLAHRLRGRLPKGSRLPDPLADHSFAAFANRPEFRQAIGEMRR